MVGEKVNLPKVIFYYWMPAFKDKFNPKVNKNLVPYGMLFTQIMRDVSVDMFGMALSGGATQLKGIEVIRMSQEEWLNCDFAKFS